MRTPYVFVDNNGNKLRDLDECEREAINAVGSHVAKKHTCMIAKEGDQPNPIGSGTFVQMGSQLFVATAKHLFKKFKDDDLVGIYWGEEDNRVGATMKNIIKDDNLDLAAIPLPPDTEACGWPSKDREHDQQELEPELFVISGIPTQKCDIDLDSKVLQVGHVSLGCVELPPQLWPTNQVEPVDLLLNYTRNYARDCRGDPMGQIAPFGLSGGGIWSVPKSADGNCAPGNARLVAIQASVESDKWRYLRCTRIEPWIRLLSNC